VLFLTKLEIILCSSKYTIRTLQDPETICQSVSVEENIEEIKILNGIQLFPFGKIFKCFKYQKPPYRILKHFLKIHSYKITSQYQLLICYD
jgi:hypothetical protein